MENKQQGGTVGAFLNDGTLGTFKRYFPYAVILALSWFILKLVNDNKELHGKILQNAEKQEAFWRESSAKTTAILHQIIQEQNLRNRHENKSDENR